MRSAPEVPIPCVRWVRRKRRAYATLHHARRRLIARRQRRLPPPRRVSVRADDDPGRANVVGEAGGFVHREEIEVGTAAGGPQEASGKRVRVSGVRKGGRTPNGLPPRYPACPETTRGGGPTFPLTSWARRHTVDTMQAGGGPSRGCGDRGDRWNPRTRAENIGREPRAAPSYVKPPMDRPSSVHETQPRFPVAARRRV